MSKDQAVAEAILRTMESPNEVVNGIEPANVVEALFFIGRAINRLSDCVEGMANATLIAHDK